MHGPGLLRTTTAEEENTFHYYTGNAIPWFVRALWILFWCGAIAYVVIWLLAAPSDRADRPAMTSLPPAARSAITASCRYPQSWWGSHPPSGRSR